MRYIQKFIENDLKKKMVIISGPRQCGKTTIAKDIIKGSHSLYLNWDDIDEKKRILKRDWTDEDKIIALDEIHKFSRWKNFLKGTYDTQKDHHSFLITGSARLDIYKKGQDSMLGRFFSWRLHPLCLSELKHQFKVKESNLIDRLLELGGFPEAFFSRDIQFSKRWRKEKINLIFRQDIRELENIKDISLLEIFYFQLTERVGSEIVLANIARDIEIAPKTAKSWLATLERTYALFVVTPYFKNLTKAIVKAPKVYFYDNGEVQGDQGALFENLVANHLLKKIHFLEDSTGDRYELNFIRDRDGHEVDFVIIKNRKPILLIEAKLSDQNVSPHLYYFMKKLNINKAIQLVHICDKTKTQNGVKVINAEEWLSQKLEEEF
jgi:predicted AAA+ superfamily ATPase